MALTQHQWHMAQRQLLQQLSSFQLPLWMFKPQLLAGGAIAALAATPLVMGNAPLALSLRIMGGTAGVLYWVQVERRDRHEKVLTLQQEWQEKFELLEAERIRVEGELVQQRAAILQEREVWVVDLSQEKQRLQGEIQAQRSQVEQEYRDKLAVLEGDRQQLQVYLQTEIRRLEEDRVLLQKHAEQLEVELRTRQTEMEAQLKERQREAEKKLEYEKDYLLHQWNTWEESLRHQLQGEIEQREMQIAVLEDRLSKAIAVKRPAGISRCEWVADDIITLCWDFKLPVDYSDSADVDGIYHVWLEPRETVTLARVKDVAKEIPNNLDGIDGDVDVSMSGGVIHLEIATSKEKSSQREIEALTLDGYGYFKKAIADSNHDLVCGGTGGGKSTLVSNLIDAASTDLKDAIASARKDWEITIAPDVAIQIIDPKFPRTVRRVNGQRVKPQYRGFDRWTDPDGNEHPSALDGCLAMDIEIRSRLDRAMLADYEGGLSTEQPIIFVVDEAEQLVADNSKRASEPMLFASRVGRSELVRCIVIGQNSNPSAYGFQRPHLNNFTRWFLGDSIDRGIEEVCSTSIQKRKYRNELVRLQKIGMTDASKRFYALVKFPNHRPVFVYLPPPGYFAQQMSDEPAVELAPLEHSEAGEGNIYDLVEQAKTGQTLTVDQQAVIDFLRSKKDWVTPSRIKAERNAYKGTAIATLMEIYQQLEGLNLVEWNEERTRIKAKL